MDVNEEDAAIDMKPAINLKEVSPVARLLLQNSEKKLSLLYAKPSVFCVDPRSRE